MDHLFWVGGEGEAERAKGICIKSIWISTIATVVLRSQLLCSRSLASAWEYLGIILCIFISGHSHICRLHPSSSSQMPSNLFIPFLLGGMILTVASITLFYRLPLNAIFRVQVTRYGPNGRQALIYLLFSSLYFILFLGHAMCRKL